MSQMISNVPLRVRASLTPVLPLLFALGALSCSESNEAVSRPDAAALPEAPDANTGTPLYTLPSTELDGTVSCQDAVCEVLLSQENGPSRSNSRGRADTDRDLVFDGGMDRTNLIWASEEGIYDLDFSSLDNSQLPLNDFSRPVNGRIWVAMSNRLLQVDQQGQVWHETTDLPKDGLENHYVDTVGDTLIFGGHDTEADRPYGRAWQRTGSTWSEILYSELAAFDEVVAISDEHALLLATGYYYIWKVGEGITHRMGGSDDIFNGAVRCTTTEFWAGGGTGLTDHANVEGESTNTFFGYVFGGPSVGCLGNVVWFLAAGVLTSFTVDETRTETERPELRHFWTDLGVAWHVIEPESF